MGCATASCSSAWRRKRPKLSKGKKVDGQFQFTRDKSVDVNHYYFYINDADFGPLFIKVCSYAPWGIKLCLNGHEWAKRQLEKRGLGFRSARQAILPAGNARVPPGGCHVYRQRRGLAVSASGFAQSR